MTNETVEEALQRASFSLRKAGLEAPRVESELLLAWAAGWERVSVYLKSAELLPREVELIFYEGVRRRQQGEPFAYITGKKEFYGFEYGVDRRVLIPRPETEFIVEAALQWADGQGFAGGDGITALDLGSGSGALAVTLSLLLPRSLFYAVDISEEALQVAAENASRHGVSDRVKLLHSDFFQAIGSLKPEPCFNLVVSNPPYINHKDLSSLPETVKDFEPRLALDGGEDGLDAYRRILEGLPRYIQSRCFVALEIGAGQQKAVEALCLNSGLFRSIKFRRDYSGRLRVMEGLI